MNADTPNAAKTGQTLAIAKLLAAGLSHREAAQKLGISERTVQRRAATDGFRDLVEAERRAQVGSVVEELTDAAPLAARVLKGMLLNSSTRPTLRARVAGQILDQFARHTVPARVEMSGSLGLEQIQAMSPEEVDLALAGLAEDIAKLRGDDEPARPAVRDSAPPERPDVPEAVPAAETATAPPQDANDTGDSGDQPPAPDAAPAPEPEPADEDVPQNVVPIVRPWQPDPRLTSNPWRDDDPLGRPIWP